MASPLVHAQDQFARHYVDGETAYQAGDWTKSERKFLESIHSPDAPKSRGARVRLVSQQYGYFPEYYLAMLYAEQKRYNDVLKYAAIAKGYIRGGDPLYLTLVNAESQARNALASGANAAGTRSFERPRTDPALDPIAGGAMHALVVGIDRYDDKAFPPLKTAVSDARAVAAELRDHYGFETTLLIDATRREIISALDGYRRRVDGAASLLIYYGGHGYYDKDADKASWLPRDAEESVTANWIKADEITSQIRAIPARHILVISDSCYSGGLTREVVASFTDADHSRYVQRAAAGTSRTLLSSGANEPVADGGGGPNHSVFAAALLKGLAAVERDSFTALELFRDYVAVSVAGRSQQSPQYVPIQNSGHEGGDFVFRRKTP